MTILTIPFVGISLLEHSAGGAILAKGGAYLAGTYLTPPVAQAFTMAATVLGSLSSGAATLTSSPALVAGLVVAVVAAGSFCYFYGLPMPIEAALAKAGLGSSSGKALVLAGGAKGFAIPVASLSVALVLLGGAGYVSYRLYQSKKEAVRAVATLEMSGDARSAAEAAFGGNAWSRFGEALWSGVGDAVDHAAKLAANAVDAVGKAAGDAGTAAAGVAGTVAGTAYDAGSRLGRNGSTVLQRLKALFRRRPPT